MSISQAERDKIPAEDFAGPGRSFPIRNQSDVEDAARLIGHADDPEAVKRRILAICKRKGLKPPEAWAEKKSMDETLISFGGAVKALGNGRIAGYLVAFSTPDAPDLEGEFFTAKTDFGDPLPEKTPVYYQHGQDPAIGKRRLGTGTLKADEVGVWIEAQLDLRDRYEKAIYGLAEANKLGWSSGTASHLVEREAAGKAHAIKHWPLGLDASLTPNPCQPHGTGAVALKAWEAPSLEDLIEADPAIKVTYDTAASGRTSYDRVSGAASRHMSAHHAVVLAAGSGSLKADEAVAGLNRSSALLEGLCSKKSAPELEAFDVKSVLVPGADFEEKAERVVSICTAFGERAEEKQEARAKSGRRLSRATRDSIAAVRDSLTTLLGEEEAAEIAAASEQKSQEAESAPEAHSALVAQHLRFQQERGRELLGHVSGATT